MIRAAGGGTKTVLALAAVFFVALGMRALPHGAAFRQGRVYFYGSDSWHHMRRIHYAAAHGWSMPEPDPLLNFPEGSYSQWGWLFDGIAAAALSCAGAASQAAEERAAAWVPAILGALCVIPAFFLGAFLIPLMPVLAEKTRKESRPPPEARPAFNPAAGLLTALFTALLPGHGEYTMLGNLDHHVMESLLFAVIAACFVQTSRAISRPRLWAALSGVSLALIYAQHPVLGNLYGGVFWAVCLIQLLIGRQDRGWWLPFLLAGAAMLPPAFHSLRLAPVGLQVPGRLPAALIFLRCSFFQPAALFFFSLTLLLAARLGNRSGEIPGPRPSAFSAGNAALAAAALACAAAVALPFALSASILFGKHRLYNLTAENMPILFYATGQGFKPSFAHSMYGWLFLAFPLWWLWQARSKEKNLILLALTATVFSLVMFQVRFVYLFSYAFALAAASSWLRLWRRRKALGFTGWAAAALFWLSFIPCARWWSALAGASPYKYISISDEFYEAAQWLRGRAPAVGGFDDISRRPEWSVLAQWDQGHALSYLAQKAVVADPFNHGMEPSARYYAAEIPREAVRVLDEKKVRYVFARDMSQAGWSEVYADFLNLPAGHPLRSGAWWRLFQMRLLLNLPVAGPDGHPFRWGHSLAFISANGREAIFAYDPARVRGFRSRAWSAPPGAAAEVAGRAIARADVDARARMDACIAGRADPFESFLSLFKARVLEEILKDIPAARLEEETASLRRWLGPTAACVEKAAGGWSAAERLYARPRVLELMAREQGQAAGIADEDIFFRLARPKLRYRVHDRAWEERLMSLREPFLTALDHDGA